MLKIFEHTFCGFGTRGERGSCASSGSYPVAFLGASPSPGVPSGRAPEDQGGALKGSARGAVVENADPPRPGGVLPPKMHADEVPRGEAPVAFVPGSLRQELTLCPWWEKMELWRCATTPRERGARYLFFFYFVF